MNKLEFLTKLREGLSHLPPAELAEQLTFYREMIDDRMEEGLSEEEAVAAVGSVDEIVSQIVADMPFSSLEKQWVKPKKRLGALEIVLLVLGSPIWISLAIAAFAVVFSLYITLWAVVISLWAVPISLAGTALGCAIAAVVFFFQGSGMVGVALLGICLICAGLAVFAFFAVRAAVKAAVWLSRKGVLAIKNCFAGRRGRHE